MNYPEIVTISRHIDPVRWAGGGYVFKVTARLSSGRAIRWYEAELNGLVTPAETRRGAFDVLRNANPRSPP